MSFLDEVIPIGPEQSINLFLNEYEIFSGELLLHDPLHQVN